VYILCRSQDRMDNSIKLIEQEKLNGSIHGIICDLKSLESVRTAAAEVLSKVEKIDICLLNAGIMRVPLELIRGIESQQFVNHFSHFLLLNLLYPKIESLEGGK
jgi:NAD(P)-dependent dehydrogenase (short-subunit alcohol dehydrogenase family)